MAEPPQIDWGDALAEHAGWLRRVVHVRLGESQAVDEVMQDVALAAVKQPSRPCDPEKLSPWLYRVAVRAVLLYRRRMGRHRRLIERCWDRRTASGSVEPVDWLLADERRELVRAALSRLPARTAEILLLKYAENWSSAQIAARLNVSQVAVETRLHRARRQLRQELEDR
jgi:RNA polymerase sigma-70 factor (ECF subfamily)